MIDFNQLSPQNSPNLWQNIASIDVDMSAFGIELSEHTPPDLSSNLSQDLNSVQNNSDNTNNLQDESEQNENEQNNWLMTLFNRLFLHHNTILVHAETLGKDEPEYLPPDDSTNQPAKICFAHGFFASALHEISHWTIAGKHRRGLADFGYWYAPDGRSESQQHDFEQVEIKPQAIECLLTLACGRTFRVSQDNLFADFDTSNSTFEADVYQLALHFLQQPDSLPRDARLLLVVVFRLVQTDF